MKGPNFGRILIGGMLLLWGVSWLLDNMGLNEIIARLDWDKVWPVVLIFVGLSLFRWDGVKGALIGSIITLTTIALVLMVIFRTPPVSNPLNVRIERNFENRRVEIVREERLVANFNRVELSGIGKLIITQGKTEGMAIEADKRVAEQIKTEVNGDTLVINYEDNNWWRYLWVPRGGVEMKLTVKNLDEVTINGAATLEINGLKTDKLRIEANGATKGNIETEANLVEAEINGASSLEIRGNNKEVDIEISGAGKTIVDEVEVLKVKISGGGIVEYKGNPEIEKEISGAGRIEQIGN